MIVDKADVILQYSNGKTFKAGTLEITADKSRMTTNVKCFWRRAGLEMVRKGLWLLISGGKKAEESDGQIPRPQD